MESPKTTENNRTTSTEPVDPKAMLAALDAMNGGPARDAMETIGEGSGDIPTNNPKHDLADK